MKESCEWECWTPLKFVFWSEVTISTKAVMSIWCPPVEFLKLKKVQICWGNVLATNLMTFPITTDEHWKLRSSERKVTPGSSTLARYLCLRGSRGLLSLQCCCLEEAFSVWKSARLSVNTIFSDTIMVNSERWGENSSWVMMKMSQKNTVEWVLI